VASIASPEWEIWEPLDPTAAFSEPSLQANLVRVRARQQEHRRGEKAELMEDRSNDLLQL
jgi:hypothetical protein